MNSAMYGDIGTGGTGGYCHIFSMYPKDILSIPMLGGGYSITIHIIMKMALITETSGSTN